MKKLATMLGFALLVCISGVWAMGDFIVPKSWNYKITIDVETPEGVKTGSAVRKVKGRREAAGYINPSAGVVRWEVVGEAAVIDLGKYGIVLDLPSYSTLFKAFPHGSSETAVAYYESSLALGDIATIDPTEFRLYTFTDINDPKSIKTVTTQNFEDVFGQGVSVKKIQIEITNDEVSFGQVRKHLPWFDKKIMGLSLQETKSLLKAGGEVDQAKFFRQSDLIILER